MVDQKGIAIYVADIIYRSDAIKLHIDLLASARAAGKGRSAKARATAGAASGGVLPSCN